MGMDYQWNDITVNKIIIVGDERNDFLKELEVKNKKEVEVKQREEWKINQRVKGKR